MKRQSKNLKQRWLPGAIHEIDLMDGTFTYAQVLEDPMVAFFDLLRKKDEARPTLDQITHSKLLFRLSLYDEAIKNDWLRIGKTSYDAKWDIYPDRFVIDCETGAITIWKEGIGQVPASEEEVKNMERFAIWGTGSAEQRLRDHFAGRPCWFVESKKPRWKNIPIKEFYARYGYDFHWLDDEESEQE